MLLIQNTFETLEYANAQVTMQIRGQLLRRNAFTETTQTRI